MKQVSDIPFSKDDAHAFLPWVIGIMACLATLLLCLGITVGGWIVDRHDTYTNSFTVNIPADTDNLSDKAPKIKDALQKLPGVILVSQVSERKLRDMLAPWLGNSDAADNLPLPMVFDVAVEKTAAIDYKSLQNKMASIAQGTEVDGHERWLNSFSDFSAAMRSMMNVLAALIVGGLALIIAFASRAALKLHARTVQLLHSIGAEDSYITHQFQRDAFLLTLRGTVPGCLFAGVAYWLSGFYVSSLKSTVLPSLAMGGTHILLLLVMPIACASVAWIAARLSIIQQLKHRL